MLKTMIKAVIVAMTALVLVRCANQTNATGGSSVSGNARVVGSLFYGNGSPAKYTQASLIPVDYNPRRDAALPVSSIIATDSSGGYSFDVADSGSFNIQAIASDQKAVLVKKIQVAGKTVSVPADTLRTPGAIRIALPENIDPATGYAYIPGTTLWAAARDVHNTCIVISGVPVDSVANVFIAASLTSAPHVLQDSVVVTAGDTTVIVNPAWRYTAKLFLNTTAQGAGVNKMVVDFPVYLLLTSWNFNFDEANVNGRDLRFTKSDGTPLAFDIGQWDSWNGTAEIWVKVDTVYGNNDKQYILMYWGNPDAVGSCGGAKVFDTANGFQGVWHLAAEALGDSARDATLNHYTGEPWFMRPSSIDRWNIGLGRSFNGSSCIAMPQTAISKLSVPQNGSYTISAWVYIDTPDTAPHLVAGMGGRYCLMLRSSQGDPRWEFVNFADTAATAWKSVIDDNPALPGNWSYLFGVRDVNGQYLYVNGRRVQSPARATPGPASLPRGGGRDFFIGGFLLNGPDSALGSGCFSGIIDEVRFENVARSADWIRLSYENQQMMDSLGVFVKQNHAGHHKEQ